MYRTLWPSSRGFNAFLDAGRVEFDVLLLAVGRGFNAFYGVS
jgi:hypothetical protein